MLQAFVAWCQAHPLIVLAITAAAVIGLLFPDQGDAGVFDFGGDSGGDGGGD